MQIFALSSVCAIHFYGHLFFFSYIILCLLPQSAHTVTRLLSAPIADLQILTLGWVIGHWEVIAATSEKYFLLLLLLSQGKRQLLPILNSLILHAGVEEGNAVSSTPQNKRYENKPLGNSNGMEETSAGIIKNEEKNNKLHQTRWSEACCEEVVPLQAEMPLHRIWCLPFFK